MGATTYQLFIVDGKPHLQLQIPLLELQQIITQVATLTQRDKTNYMFQQILRVMTQVIGLTLCVIQRNVVLPYQKHYRLCIK